MDLPTVVAHKIDQQSGMMKTEQCIPGMWTLEMKLQLWENPAIIIIIEVHVIRKSILNLANEILCQELAKNE